MTKKITGAAKLVLEMATLVKAGHYRMAVRWLASRVHMSPTTVQALLADLEASQFIRVNRLGSTQIALNRELLAALGWRDDFIEQPQWSKGKITPEEIARLLCQQESEEGQ